MTINCLNCVSILIILTVKDCWSIDIKELECPFTEGLCGWSTTKNVWQLGDYEDKSFGKPIRDTFGGGYIFTSYRTSELISPEIGENEGPFCLAFAYYMFGYGSTRFSVFLANTNRSGDDWVMSNNEIWRSDRYKEDDWRKGYYHVDSDQRTKTRIIISVDQSTASNFSLGPITVKPGQCDYIEFCDFENPSSCSWTIKSNNSSVYTWLTSKGSNSPELVSYDATIDHPKGQYLRTTDDGLVGSTSTLATIHRMDLDKVKCLHFNLVKRNTNSDRLTISLLQANQTESQSIWISDSVTSDSTWQPIEINVNETGQFDILIAAHKHSDGTETAIAIDDLRINSNPCSMKIDCSFDNLNCRMSVASGHMLIGFGRLSNGKALNYSTNSFKNNDPNDFFIYTDVPIEPTQVNYRFRSQLISTINDSCLSFFYFMELIEPLTDQDYTFKVNVQSIEGSIESTYEPLVVHGQWTKDEFQIPRMNHFYIEFVLITESKLFTGLDDIKLMEGECASLN